MRKQQGFTLIELLVVIGIIAVLAAVVIVAVNPGRQFAQARDTQRWSNVNTIVNAIGQNIADNRGNLVCNGTTTNMPTTTTAIGTAGFDLEPCIVPTYVSIMPTDPQTGTSTDTGYTILYDGTTRRVTIDAPAAEITAPISVTQ